MPGDESSRAYCEAVSSETVTVIERPVAGSLAMTEPGAIAVRSPTSTIVFEPSLSVARANPACVASAANRTESALPRYRPECPRERSASVLADAASLSYTLPASAATQPARASAFPCSLSLIRRNMSTPIATIGHHDDEHEEDR